MQPQFTGELCMHCCVCHVLLAHWHVRQWPVAGHHRACPASPNKDAAALRQVQCCCLQCCRLGLQVLSLSSEL